ncbi:MAG: hypothetical protein WBO08_18050 [Mycobacterium sp.]
MKRQICFTTTVFTAIFVVAGLFAAHRAGWHHHEFDDDRPPVPATGETRLSPLVSDVMEYSDE